MANNRLWLIHQTSKTGIMLGKRMGWGWYQPPEAIELQEFYDFTSEYSDNESQDDFILVREDQPGWNYTRRKLNGFAVFELEERETPKCPNCNRELSGYFEHRIDFYKCQCGKMWKGYDKLINDKIDEIKKEEGKDGNTNI